jgi:hypothetical protein
VTKARLVKRKEAMERKRLALASAASVSTASTNIHSIIQQLNRRQSIRLANPRETFAALFARPQTS